MVFASHRRMVRSMLLDTSHCPSAENATALTALECTVRVDMHDPEVMSHILMVSSSEQLMRMLELSGLKATQFTSKLLKHTRLVLKTRHKVLSRKARGVPMPRQGRYARP